MAVLRAKQSTSPKLTIRLLGRFEVFRDGKPIPEEAWGRRKTKTLLKVLLTDPGRVFTQDQLIDALFGGENVDKATENLYGRVSQLRRALEPELTRGVDSTFITREGQGYSFDVSVCGDLDTIAFKQGLDDSQLLVEEKDWTAAVERFEETVALYRGEFLAEDRYDDWAEEARSQWRRQHLDAMVQLAECYEQLGRLRQAVSCCQRILGIEPYRESVIRQLMRYQHETDQRAQALDTYIEGESALREHLDVEPSPETRALHQQIVTGKPKKGTKLDPRRIAVIPFVNVGSDPSNEFLADGMTEELIYTLSKVAGLEVIAQTTVLKYKGARKGVAEIGQELRVGSLLEGSVQKVKDRARILVQLINVESEAHLWAEQYDRELQDVLSVQGDVARKVAAALKVQLLAKEEKAIRKEEASDSEAHVAYLKGRLFLAKRTRDAYVKAIEYFEQARAIAPDYARAFTGLADAYSLMVEFISAAEGYEKANGYTQQALALDPLCAEAHATLGYIIWRSQGDIHEAEREFLRAIELNPNYALAHEWYARLLIHTGKIKEACQQSENALSLDPLSAPLILTYAQSLHEAGRLIEAVDQYQKALEINPELETAWWGLWYSLAAAWDWDRAEAVTREIVVKYPNNPCAYVNLSTCVMNRGRLEEGLAAIQKALELEPEPRRAYVLFHAGMRFYFARDFETAIDFFKQTLARNPSWNHAHLLIAKVYRQQECFDEALEEIAATEHMFGGADPFWQVHVHMERGRIYAARGETEKAEKELATLMNSSGRQNRRIAISGVLLELGRVDEAMDWLEAAATAREAHVAALRMAPSVDAARSHPRFQALLKRIGLAD